MMELLHQPYEDIMAMPVKRFYDILQLKVKLDEEREKAELNTKDWVYQHNRCQKIYNR